MLAAEFLLILSLTLAPKNKHKNAIISSINYRLGGTLVHTLIINRQFS